MRFIALIILQALYFFPCAQNTGYRFDIYKTRNGLSNNSINAIIKDHRNFMWIGTAEGLNRFDGNHFVSFFSDREDSATLSGNNTFDILEYQPGYLLIATNNGLSVFNTWTNGFENGKITMPALRKGSGNFVWSLFKDKQSRIYINHPGGIDVFNDSLVWLYRLTDLPWARSIARIIVQKEKWMQDSEGRIWLPSDNQGICIIDERKKVVYTSANNPEGYPFLTFAPIRGFLYDEQQQVLWYSQWGEGLTKYDLQKKKFQQQLFNLSYGNEARCINSITKEKNGRLICGGGQAIYSVDPVTLEYKIINENFAPNSLPAFLGTTIFNDSSYIWIGTETKGLMKLPGSETLVRQVPLPYPLNDYTNFSTGIVYSDNKLYLAYGADGLVEIDPVSLVPRRYPVPAAWGRNGSVFRICEDKEKQLWVGAASGGIFIFDKITKEFKTPDWLPAYLRHLSIYYLFCDSKGNIWISFQQPNSLGCYNAAEKKFYYYKNYNVNGQPVFDYRHRISRMMEDAKGNIWMISYDWTYHWAGIICHEALSGQWKLYANTKKTPAFLANNPLNSIYPAGEDEVWLSNEQGHGLVKYNYITENLSSITRRDGLLSDNILSITKGKNDDIFLVSKTGINLFNTVTREIWSLRLTDENINMGFAYHQFYDSLNRQLVYGLNDRLVLIKDKVWASLGDKLVTYIDDITVNNKPVYLDPLLQKMSLSYTEKNITINFASPCYVENSSLAYSYKMEGVDKDWIVTSQSQGVNYTNLSPGHYTFFVKTRNQSGQWGPVNNSLQIVIAPPFWQTWWFITVFVFLITLSVYLLFRRRIKTIRHEAELKQKIAETEMIALRAQMNPHFIFNCLNSIDNLIQSSQKEKATTYLAKFAKLIRAILENSKNNVIPCWKDLETLKLYLELEEFRWDKKFSYTLTIDNEILQGDYKVPPLVIQPFVENAIHHGLLNKTTSDKKLNISVNIEDNYIKYIVEDNGIGRAQASVYKKINNPSSLSLGMELTTERINLFNQKNNGAITITDLADANGLPLGTRVEVCLVNQS
jgi:ligand-binding sensor domain-containing protein